MHAAAPRAIATISRMASKAALHGNMRVRPGHRMCREAKVLSAPRSDLKRALGCGCIRDPRASATAPAPPSHPPSASCRPAPTASFRCFPPRCLYCSGDRGEGVDGSLFDVKKSRHWKRVQLLLPSTTVRYAPARAGSRNVLYSEAARPYLYNSTTAGTNSSFVRRVLFPKLDGFCTIRDARSSSMSDGLVARVGASRRIDASLGNVSVSY